MNPKPLKRISKTLCLLLKVNIGIMIFSVLANIYGYYSYSQLPKAVDPGKTFLLSDAFMSIVDLATLIMFPVLGVIFLRWTYRTNKNLHALSSQRLRFSPGWAVGWYFVPIACLFKPYQAMKEIWAISHREINARSAIINLWWFLWIVSSFFDAASMKYAILVEDAESFLTSSLVTVASSGVEIALSAVVLSMVAGIWAAYSKNFLAH